jgi:hypothetical protein
LTRTTTCTGLAHPALLHVAFFRLGLIRSVVGDNAEVAV